MTATTTLPDPRPDAAELSTARRIVANLVCDLPGGTPGEQGFEHPWEIRAFAMAVAAHHQLEFDWSEFQQALIISIRTWEAAGAPARQWSYYEHWVAALESVLGDAGVLEVSTVDARTRDVLAIPPNRNHHEAHAEPIAIDPARVVHI